MNIRKYRRTKNLTLVQLGRRIGVSAATVSRYETGTRRPRYRVMLKIKAVTNGQVTLEDWE